MNLHLTDRVILVSGGAKGIGAAIARVLAAEGAVPVVIGRNAADNERLVADIARAGGTALAVTAELTRTDECQRAVDEARVKFGRIDGLVNNAGINDGVNLEHGDTERFLASLRKNLIHYYELAHFALPELKTQPRGDRQHRLEGGRNGPGWHIGLCGSQRRSQRPHARMGCRAGQVRHSRECGDRRRMLDAHVRDLALVAAGPGGRAGEN